MFKPRLTVSIKTGIWQLCFGNRDQTSCEVIKNGIDGSFACPKLCDYLFIKAGKDLVSGVFQVLVDLVLKVLLQKVELLLNFFIGSRGLENVQNTLFKINAALNHTENFVTSTKDPAEKLELALEKLINTRFSPVLPVKKIDHQNINLLTIPMTAANALFNTLGSMANQSSQARSRIAG